MKHLILNSCLFVPFPVQDLNENSEKKADEDAAFGDTHWFDLTDGYSSRQQKKVNVTLPLLTTFTHKLLNTQCSF